MKTGYVKGLYNKMKAPHDAALPQNEIENRREVFRYGDVNGDGRLT